ncbi:sensor histidine kinase [Methylocaldum sp.]|uniref:sensor histidine kinase n=1 Tax=Methylocaldum sp. TaxID=1969727 RepID=UPI002D4F3603|nr:sensor histidine kinase N-terminal domain-containing protein [Methylocaldum sp.]HYE35451.1 sensor histidine kinase N-terminal domain-containing protein [Methylocaldum sp.]
MAKVQSLRTRFLLRLALPLALFMVLDAVTSYYIALHYANAAYDRWLLDSARSLAQEVKAQKGKVTFELPATALEVFQWDEVDQTFFKIESSHLGFMAGDKRVPSPPDLASVREQPAYFDSIIEGQKVRVVSMLATPKDSSEEVLVQVAETVKKRRSMMTDILLAELVPQFLLVFVAGLYIWIGINRGLRPLNALTREIGQRSPRDLAPIPDTGVPLEVLTLTHTINDLLARLATAIAAQQRFIANAAHQLRTPLAGLKVQAERALRETDLATMRPALTQIRNCADRASRLSTQLLVLARSETALDSARPGAWIDLRAIASDACMDWVPKALQRDIDLSFDGPEGPVYVHGEGTLLRELLNNLVDNAIRYGREHGQITVRLTADTHPCLVVEDDGPGIPESETERIFERFYRIPGSPGDGSGLGLPIVKEIADLHNARVRLSRSDLGGVRVEVLFACQAPLHGDERLIPRTDPK